MLEIPESHTVARQLNQEITGRKITDAVAAQSPHGFAWYFGEPKGYGDLLRGRVIDGARATAGYVEISAGDMRILFNDGVNARLIPQGAKLPPKHQLMLRFDDESSLVCTVQMYGGMAACRDGEYDNSYFTVAREKSSPLSDAFDEAYFDGIYRAASPKLSAKGLLATEQRIPGLGNGCLQDILFTAGINPKTKLSVLTDEKLEDMFKSVKAVLADMTERGGRDTEKDIYGNPGGYHTLLSAKTAAYACPGCGGSITRVAYMGGNVYYCETCQPL